MSKPVMPEVWLRGPLPGMPALLQPVAHALLQAREEVIALMQGFPEEHLWARPAGVASPGFHLQHLAGVLDRLFTYAAGQALNGEQLAALAAEGKPPASHAVPAGPRPEGALASEEATIRVGSLVRELTDRFNREVDKS